MFRVSFLSIMAANTAVGCLAAEADLPAAYLPHLQCKHTVQAHAQHAEQQVSQHAAAETDCQFSQSAQLPATRASLRSST
jgi:hypothetical protein